MWDWFRRLWNGSPAPKPTPKPAPKPAPEPEKKILDKAWREIDWTDKRLTELRGQIESIELPEDIPKPKVLLYGFVGAGKSSFINSCCSVAKNRKVTAVASGRAASSYTTQFRCVTEAKFNNFELCDTMGLEVNRDSGIVLEDAESLIKGHIKPTYRFNPVAAIDKESEFYIKNPERKDKVYCIVFMVHAESLLQRHLPSDEITRKIQEMSTLVRRFGMNRILVITHIDEVCDEARKDIKMTYKSVRLQKVANKGRDLFDVDLKDIHLVKNYHEHPYLDTETSILIFTALQDAVQSAADYLEYCNEKP